MKLSDLEKILFPRKNVSFNKDLETRISNLTKNDVVKYLSGDNKLTNLKIDELNGSLLNELKSFFDESFWCTEEVDNG